MTSRGMLVIAAIGMAAAIGTSARAAITLGNGDSVTLQSILSSSDRQVNIGDKTFTFTSYNSGAFNASNVFIAGFIASNPLNGIGFDITGGFGDTNPTDTAFTQFTLGYTVEVQSAFLAQGYRLKDVGAVFNGTAIGTGSYATVGETIADFSTATQLASLSLSAVGGGPNVLQDARDFSPASYSKLTVNKDVRFFANGPTGTASASFVRQTFSQVIVPAPGAAAVVGLGGLVALRRRRA